MIILWYENDDCDIWEWDVDPATRQPIIPPEELEEVRTILLDEKHILGFWNAKFDLFMLESIGIEIPFRFDDGTRKIEEVRWMAKCCNNLEFSYHLKQLSDKYIGIDNQDEKDLGESVKKARFIGKKLGWKIATKESHGDKETYKADYWLPRALHKAKRKIRQVYPDWKNRLAPIDPEACFNYGSLDGKRTMDLWKFYIIGMNDLELWDAYDMEMDLLPYTMEMERKGIRIDSWRMIRVKKECQALANEALARLQEATTIEDFNPNSSQQVQKFCYGGNPLNLEVLKKTKNGNPSTDAESLIPYSVSDPLVGDIFAYKANTKAISTFFDNYDKFAEIKDGQKIVHPGLNQAGTLTWRYSCEKPNLQQVSSPETTNSRSKDFVVDIRQVFIPRYGYYWLLPDYSQVEVILFADIYNVGTMLEAIRRGEDVHEATANAIWGGKDNDLFWRAAEEICENNIEAMQAENTSLEWLAENCNYAITAFEKHFGQKNYRKLAKTVTFTNTYGGGYKCLMSWLGISAAESRKIIEDYFNAFPDMREKMDEQEARGRKDGYIITKFGTRLAVDKWAAYKIVNHEIQHSAGQLLKMGMRKCARWIKESKLDGYLGMTVHDENIFELSAKLLAGKVITIKNKEGHDEEVYKMNRKGLRVARKLCELMSDHEGIFSVDTPVDMDICTARWSEKVKVQL